MTALCTWGVGAYPLPVEVRQSDGTLLTVLLHGDEDFHYYTTTDGVLLVQKETKISIITRQRTGSFWYSATAPIMWVQWMPWDK